MRRSLALMATLLAWTPCLAPAQEMAVTHVAVVDVERGLILEDRTVLVSGGRIARMAPADQVTPPSDAVVVDGRGRYLIPGLWDMHVHSSTDEITRRVLFPVYIANGVTGVRNMEGDCVEPCRPLRSSAAMTLARRRDVEAGRLVGPRVFAAGPIVYGQEPGEPSTVQAPGTEEHGRALARLHAERGVDFIKVYDQVPAEAFRGLADEGRRLGLPVAGHIPWEMGSVAAAEAGMRSFEHLYGIIDDCSATVEVQRPAVIAAYRSGDDTTVMANLLRSLENFSTERCDPLYAELAKHEVWQVPTLVVGIRSEPAEWRDHPGMRYLPRQEVDFWMGTLASDAMALPGGLASWPLINYRVELISRDMYRAGVPILAGSDALTPGVFPGFALHEELERLVGAGLTPAEALRAATLEPARFMEATDTLGSIAPGKVADLVLLDADPLRDIRNTTGIHAVIARGRLYTREELDGLLDSAAAAATPGASTGESALRQAPRGQDQPGEHQHQEDPLPEADEARGQEDGAGEGHGQEP